MRITLLPDAPIPGGLPPGIVIRRRRGTTYGRRKPQVSSRFARHRLSWPQAFRNAVFIYNLIRSGTNSAYLWDQAPVNIYNNRYITWMASTLRTLSTNLNASFTPPLPPNSDSPPTPYVKGQLPTEPIEWFEIGVTNPPGNDFYGNGYARSLHLIIHFRTIFRQPLTVTTNDPLYAKPIATLRTADRNIDWRGQYPNREYHAFINPELRNIPFRTGLWFYLITPYFINRFDIPGKPTQYGGHTASFSFDLQRDGLMRNIRYLGLAPVPITPQ